MFDKLHETVLADDDMILAEIRKFLTGFAFRVQSHCADRIRNRQADVMIGDQDKGSIITIMNPPTIPKLCAYHFEDDVITECYEAYNDLIGEEK